MTTTEPMVWKRAPEAPYSLLGTSDGRRGPLSWEPLPARPPRPWPAVIAPLVVLLALAIASVTVTLPYYAVAPGSARAVDDLIEAADDRLYPAKGDVLLTTISYYPVHPFEALLGWIRSDVDVVSRDRFLPPKTSDDEYRRFNVVEMDQSKQTAIVVALRRLGHAVAEHGEGALVEQVVPGFPADGRLRPGDVISAIDGQPVRLAQDASAIVTRRRPGESVRIDVTQPDGSAPRSVEVPVAADPQQRGRPVLGVVLRTHKQAYDFPFEVKIESGAIGGPSAGLAFTLGIIDVLTPGELTGGLRVAATGTIEPDGRVGDVGGVAQKTSAVVAARAQVFLVPAGEYEEARARAGSRLRVVRVTTLQDALDALAAFGGDLSGLGPAAAPGQR